MRAGAVVVTVVALAWVGVACTACAAGVASIADGIAYDDLARFAGVSVCREPRERSFSFVRASYLDTPEQAPLQAHEAMHLQQYRRWPSCAAFHAYYATTAGYLATEGEAHAAQLCVTIAHGGDSTAARADMVARLVSQGRWRGHAVTDADATTALDHFPCPAHSEAR